MILVIHPKRKSAKQTAEIFYYMGIPAVARRPKEALSEISLQYRAVLICNPSALPCPEEYVDRLRALCGETRLFALAENLADAALSPLFSMTFNADDYSSHILSEIRRLQSQQGLPLLGSYALAGLCLSCDERYPSYCGVPIPFTKTETMILRYLIRTYPEPVSVHHILRYAMRPESLSEPASVRTHIWSINRKFSKKTGRRLITSQSCEGYCILTAEREAMLTKPAARSDSKTHSPR